MLINVLLLASFVQAVVVGRTEPEDSRRSSLTENLGQWNTPARFVGEFGDTLVRVEAGGIWLHQSAQRAGEAGVLLKLSFEGSSSAATVEGRRATPTLHSYFIGNEPEKWIHAARSYEQVRLVGVYPGIDVVLGERKDALKYDVIVAPGADLLQFVMRCEGADALCMDLEGRVRIEAGDVAILHSLGNAWEERNDGTRRTVNPRWRLLDGERIGMALEDRDDAATLVIDPELSWATYLGSNSIYFNDGATAVDCAADGTVVVAGIAGDLSFPTTPGSVVIAPPGEDNMFVTKLSADGSSLVYSCIIGGSIGLSAGHDVPNCVKLDGLGRAYLAGETSSPTFPTTPGAFGEKAEIWEDGFALRLSPNGDALEYSTIVGATYGGDRLLACAVAPSGAVVLMGRTGVQNFPTTPNAFQPGVNGIEDLTVTRLSPDGSSLEWSTYFGGSHRDEGFGISLADNDDVLLTGFTLSSTNFPTTPGTIESVWQGSTFDRKAFVTRMHASGSSLVWSTLLGGPTYTGGEGTIGKAIVSIPGGDVFVAGHTTESSFPTTPGAFQTVFHYDPNLSIIPYADGFLARLNPNATGLVYSTFLGTDYYEAAIGVVVDASGVATVASRCGGLPTTAGCFQSIPTGFSNFGVSRFHPSGSRLIYSTIIGGPNTDTPYGITATPEGRVTVGGYSNGGFPVTPGSYDPTYNGGQYDAVVATLELHPTGVASIGLSTPACNGPLILQSGEMPQSGSPSFSFLCSNAPPNARGVLLIGREALVAPVTVGSSALWVDPFGRATRAVPIISDGNGFCEISESLIGVKNGARFAAQALFRHRPQCVAQGLTCASNALTIDVQ